METFRLPSPSLDPIAFQLCWLHIFDVERYNKIIDQIASCDTLNPETVCFILSQLPQQLASSTPSCGTNLNSVPPASSNELTSCADTSGNNLTASTTHQDRHGSASSLASEIFSQRNEEEQVMTLDLPDELFLSNPAEDLAATNPCDISSGDPVTNFSDPRISLNPLGHEEKDAVNPPSESMDYDSTALGGSTSLLRSLVPPDVSPASLVPEIFSHKIRAFPNEPGYIRLRQGTDLYVQTDGVKVKEITQDKFQDQNPTHIFLPAHLYPTVLFRGDKVFPWSTGNLRTAWVYGIVFAHEGSCRCQRFMWFRDEQKKHEEEEENNGPLLSSPFPKSPAEIREHTRRCKLGEILTGFLRLLEVITRRHSSSAASHLCPQ
ncbi:hypothetical protein BT69DRAFT_91599 [Atractiella rhizophila]|nr:hypothetical protein BT69DRAFT_91599 [Atractiella rhizophila]